MREKIQAGKFYRGLTEKQKKDLAETVAEDIYFLEDDLQIRILELLDDIDSDFGSSVRKRNIVTV